MSEMGSYCKAYYAKQLRGFSDWKENIANLRKEKTRTPSGEDVEVHRSELQDEDVLYLQENYVVTDGIFKDENIVFDKVTDEWKRFCTNTLGFAIPDDVRQESTAESAAPAS